MERSDPFALTLGLIVMFDVLFYGAPTGWSAGLFLLALASAVKLRFVDSDRGWAEAICFALIAGLVLALVLEPGVLAMSLGAMVLVSTAMVSAAGWQRFRESWLWRWWRYLASVPTRLPRQCLARRTEVELGSIAGGVGAWILPLLLTAGFVLLFALANPIVDLGLGVVYDDLVDAFPRLFALRRVILWIGCGLAVFALLAIQNEDHTSLHARLPSAADMLGRSTLIRCLVLFNVVFAIENALDVGFLWAGAALPEGMTYADYAHRGAYPLVATALLAAAFVLIAFAPAGAAARCASIRLLVVIWLVQNVVLTISAGARLALYVDAYGLTRLRVAAAVWMAIVALGLTAIGLRVALRYRNAWLIKTVAVSAFAILYLLSFPDIDGFIARFNVAHCAEQGGAGPVLDLDYLALLGAAALPSLHGLDASGFAPARRHQLIALRDALRSELDATLSDWRGWSVRRAAIARSVREGVAGGP